MESVTEYKDIFGSVLTFGPGQHHGSTKSFLTVVKNGRWCRWSKTLSGTERRSSASILRKGRMRWPLMPGHASTRA